MAPSAAEKPEVIATLRTLATSHGKGTTNMRIAQIAPLTESVPPRLYGGTERVVSFLTEQLVAMGHDVTLFASGDSRTSAELVSMWPCALRFDPSLRDAIAPHMLMLEQVCNRAHEFDVLHCHLDYWPFALFSRQATPFLTTLHGRLDLPELRPVYDCFPEVPLVSISDSQREPLPKANFVATIHHGLPEDLLTPQPVAPRYLAFLGRICPEKRPDRAIRIARQAGIPLKIAAKVDRVDEAYFREVIEPMIDGTSVELIGEISDAEKPAFLSGAIALLVPIDWPEPFGLVMIEAMACGTPVIAFNRGSVPEIIEHGVSGFIVEDEAEAVTAVGRVDDLSRRVVRRRFETRFSAERMAEDYLALYRRLAVRTRPALRVVT
jgi:glycosyltransferase involved in cell wall biosynthesis